MPHKICLFGKIIPVSVKELEAQGPSYDPYSATQYSFTVRNHHISVVSSLVDRATLNLMDDNLHSWERYIELTPKKLKKLTGYSLPEEIVRAIYYEDEKCCDNPDQEWTSGFPGESMLFCNNCKKIVDSHFNINAII